MSWNTAKTYTQYSVSVQHVKSRPHKFSHLAFDKKSYTIADTCNGNYQFQASIKIHWTYHLST